MKRNVLKYCFLLPAVLLITSCYNRAGREQLARAETLVEKYPDSAMTILNGMRQPEKMDKNAYMKFIVINTLAKYKTYKDVKNDTTIYDAVKYFSKSDDYKEKAQAYYAAGCVAKERNDINKAMSFYKTASKTLEGKNIRLSSLVNEHIAYLYGEQYLFDGAIKYENKVLKVLSNIPDSEKEKLNNLTNIGNYYAYKKELDSALLMYQEAYKLAATTNNTESQALNSNAIAIIYRHKGRYDASIAYLRQAVGLEHNEELKATYTMNLASTYMLNNQPDSALLHINVIEKSEKESKNLNYKAAVTEFLKEYYKSEKNYAKALMYQEENRDIHDKVFSENQSKILVEAEKKFDYTYHKSEAEKANLDKKITILFFSALLLLVIIAGLVVRNRYKHKELINKMEKRALEFEQEKQENENENLKKELSRFKYINVALYKILEKTNSLHNEINNIVQAGVLHEKSERHEKIKLRLKEAQETVMENISMNSESFLKDRSLLDDNILCRLTEEEKVMLTMLFCKESRKDIANILSISPQAVYNRIPRLKNKLTIVGVSPDIIDLFFERELFPLN